MAEIRLSSVTRRVDRTLAFDTVDLAVADGEFVVFIGPSGRGTFWRCPLGGPAGAGAALDVK